MRNAQSLHSIRSHLIDQKKALSHGGSVLRFWHHNCPVLPLQAHHVATWPSTLKERRRPCDGEEAPPSILPVCPRTRRWPETTAWLAAPSRTPSSPVPNAATRPWDSRRPTIPETSRSTTAPSGAPTQTTTRRVTRTVFTGWSCWATTASERPAWQESLPGSQIKMSSPEVGRSVTISPNLFGCVRV